MCRGWECALPAFTLRQQEYPFLVFFFVLFCFCFVFKVWPEPIYLKSFLVEHHVCAILT